jgi:hypothetical protein
VEAAGDDLGAVHLLDARARAGSSAMAFRDAAAARATSVITAAVEASAHHVERRDSSLIHSPRTTPAKVVCTCAAAGGGV